MSGQRETAYNSLLPLTAGVPGRRLVKKRLCVSRVVRNLGFCKLSNHYTTALWESEAQNGNEHNKLRHFINSLPIHVVNSLVSTDLYGISARVRGS